MKGSVKLVARNIKYCCCFSEAISFAQDEKQVRKLGDTQIVVKEEICHQPVLHELDTQSEKSVNMLEFHKKMLILNWLSGPFFLSLV